MSTQESKQPESISKTPEPVTPVLPEQLFRSADFLTRYGWWVLGAAVSAGYGIYQMDDVGWRWSSIWFKVGLFAAVAGLGQLGFALFSYFTRVQWVSLGQDGLSWEDHNGLHKCRWEDAREVSREDREVVSEEGFRFRSFSVSIRMTKARSLKLDEGIEGVRALADLVEMALASSQGPRLRDSLERGSHFGPITIYRDGIMLKGQKYAWKEIDMYRVGDGRLIIHPSYMKGYSPAEYAVEDIPNYNTLLQFLQEFTGQKPSHM
jgi:hypothetical protein